jgi:type III restriction enzyme
MATFQLKTYQARALDALTQFLRESRTLGLDSAWGYAMQREKIANVPYRKDELGDEVPCVCLRIPTGGGKTLMASHAIPRIAREWAESDFPVTLWLTPSDMIRSQTLGALKTPGHAYAQALRDAYGDKLRIVEIGELATIAPNEWGNVAIVVVATIQTFRVEKRSDRKVYSFSESFEPHFRSLAITQGAAQERGLQCVTQEDLDEEKQTFLSAADIGRVKTSAANLLAWMRPIVIVDEAHNAKTPKSLDMLRAICPAAVLDLTATPVPKRTNVLYSVAARELEAEEMIKLPILLAEHTPDLWRDAVRDAVLRRHALEREALNELEYVRPIVLFQAQDKDHETTPQVLKQHLIDNEKIPEYEIAVATGTQRELDGLNLFDPSCQIRYVITVDALREGWDCSFAYVLCSLQNLRSNSAVEQLLGRVLRMPYAKRRKSPALNKAYAQVIAKSFGDAADAMVEKMVGGMGFNTIDAAAVVLPDLNDLLGDQPAPSVYRPREAELEIELPVDVSAPAASALHAHPDIVLEKSTSAGHCVARVKGLVTDATRDALIAAAGKSLAPLVMQKVEMQNARVFAQQSPAERGETFPSVPLLCVRSQAGLQLLDKHLIEECIDFDLLGADPQPRLQGFNMIQQGEQYEIFLDGERVRQGLARDGQLSLNNVPTQVSESELVNAIARNIRLNEISPAHLQNYVGRIIAHLLREERHSLTGLVRARFQLEQAILRKVDALRATARRQGFQATLFEHVFHAHTYPARETYSGSYHFSKHFYPRVGSLNGEELECAKLIDRHPAVKTWVRNLDNHSPDFSFRILTSTDWFYPDFVVELMNGTVAVIEYKGANLSSADDSREKANIGQRWADVSGRRFAMVEKVKHGVDLNAQLNVAFL